MVLEQYLPVSLYELFPTIILPFLLTFTIFFAVLSLIKVFNKRTNVVLALALSLLAGYGGLFHWISTWVAQSMVYLAVSIFAIVFVLGALMWGMGSTKKVYYANLPPERRLRKLMERREKLMDDAAKARKKGNEKVVRARMEELRKLELEIELASREKRYT